MRKKALFALLVALPLMGGAAFGAETGEEAEAPVAATAAAEQPRQSESERAGVETPAPQRIVVTATRIPTAAAEVSDSVSVLTSELMETRQYRSVDDALKTVPGVSMNRSGGPGGLTHVYMRGLDSGRTVVLMDGMPQNDPSSIDGTFDFGNLTLDNLAQLEVLRGPQSSLYGSGASGGVINMMSKKGEGPLSGYVSAEGGSRGTVLTRMGAQAGTDKVDFSLAGSVSHTDGVSNIDKKYGNKEKDAYTQGNFSLRLGANPTDWLRLDLFTNAQKTEAELDYDPTYYGPNGFTNGDNAHYKLKTERFMIRPQATLSLFDDRWEQKVGFGYVRSERKYRDEPDETNWYFPNRSKYVGETFKFDYQSIVRLHETNTVLAGVDVVTESMQSQSPYYGSYVGPKVDPGSVTTVGAYIEDQINIGDVFFATAGVRQEHHEEFGNKTTWKASAMYVLPTETKLKVSGGTGFKAPSLYQLHIGYDGGGYYDTLPNKNLKPETTFGWDAGFEQSLFGGRLVFGSAYFRNKVKNKIDAVLIDPVSMTYQYMNRQRYRTWGVESFLQFAVTETLLLRANHTWMRTENREDSYRAMYRRPLNEFSINADWSFCERGTLTAGVKYVGRRVESYVWDGSNPRRPSYTLARVGASWKINNHVEVYGRVENLFNRKYQEVYGYGTERIGFFAGATVSF